MRRFLTWSVLSLLPLGAVLAADPKRPGSDDELPAWVDQLVKDRQPSADERRFDEIGWARDIREAERLAKEHKRPVFLFTHDGRMNVGRC
jgi:hypothetical protein